MRACCRCAKGPAAPSHGAGPARVRASASPARPRAAVPERRFLARRCGRRRCAADLDAQTTVPEVAWRAALREGKAPGGDPGGQKK